MNRYSVLLLCCYLTVNLLHFFCKSTAGLLQVHWKYAASLLWVRYKSTVSPLQVRYRSTASLLHVCWKSAEGQLQAFYFNFFVSILVCCQQFTEFSTKHFLLNSRSQWLSTMWKNFYWSKWKKGSSSTFKKGPWSETSSLPVLYTGSSGRAHSTRANSTHAHYKNVRVCIVNALKLPAKWVLSSVIHLDSTGAKSRSCRFF